MIQVAEIRNKLAAVANDQLPLFDFADWLDSNSWSMHRDSSPEAVRLVSSIDRLMAEYDHRDLFESELREKLLGLLNNIVVSIPVDVSPQLAVARPHFISSERWLRPTFRPVAA